MPARPPAPSPTITAGDGGGETLPRRRTGEHPLVRPLLVRPVVRCRRPPHVRPPVAGRGPGFDGALPVQARLEGVVGVVVHGVRTRSATRRRRSASRGRRSEVISTNRSSPSSAERTAAVSWTDGQSLLNIAYSSTSAAGTGYVDWYELFYDRTTISQGDRFSFQMPDTGAVVAFDVAGFSGTAVRAFVVARYDSVALLVPENRSDTCSVRVAGTPGERRQIFLCGPGGYLTPAGIVPVPNQDLRGAADVADMIVVAHPTLLAAANRLKEFRERPGPYELRTRVVNVEEIYNEFGGGIPSPAAIRNYLRFVAQNQSPAPAVRPALRRRGLRLPADRRARPDADAALGDGGQRQAASTPTPRTITSRSSTGPPGSSSPSAGSRRNRRRRPRRWSTRSSNMKPPLSTTPGRRWSPSWATTDSRRTRGGR